MDHQKKPYQSQFFIYKQHDRKQISNMQKTWQY